MDQVVVDEATSALEAGRVIGLPTDTVYGLAGLASSNAAKERLFALKDRPPEFALPVLVSDLEQAFEFVGGRDGRLRAIAVRFWPGPLTVVVRARRTVLVGLGGDGETAGIRCPNNDFARMLCAAVGPLAVTSANLHGEPPATTAAEVAAAFGEAVDTIVDGGLCARAPSTVVSIVEGVPKLVRAGAISIEEFARALADRP